MLKEISEKELDEYGGYKGINLPIKGKFFSTINYKNRWYLLDPEGNAFILRGVNYVRFNGDISVFGGLPYTESLIIKYVNKERWVEETVRRLREWGFNTLGAWSDDIGLPFTFNLHLTPKYYIFKGGALKRRALKLARKPDVLWQPFGTFPDVFDPDFEKSVDKSVKETVDKQLINNDRLVGYFLDNEVDFNIDVIFREFTDMSPEEPGKMAFVGFLKNYFKDSISDLNRRFNTRLKSFDDLLDYTSREFMIIDSKVNLYDIKRAFSTEVALRYANVCIEIIRKFDSNHLILGARFAGENAKLVMEAFRSFDVVSNNYYGENPPIGYLNYINSVTGRPTLLSEFSFRGRDTGHPNTRGAGIVVDNQAIRANYVKSWLTSLLSLNHFVGYIWWEYMDEPLDGRRPDGEDSNYGLVNLRDEPYNEVVNAFRDINKIFPLPD